MTKKKPLTLRNGNGGLLSTIPVEVYGLFGVHKNPERIKGWVVTHLSTGVKCMPRAGEVFKDKLDAIYIALRLSTFPSVFNFRWEEYAANGWSPPRPQAALSIVVDVECELEVLKGNYEKEEKPTLSETLPNRTINYDYPDL